MGGSKDNINELLEVIHSQGKNYILVVFEEDKKNDVIDLYTSLKVGHLKKLINIFQNLEDNGKSKRKNKTEDNLED